MPTFRLILAAAALAFGATLAALALADGEPPRSGVPAADAPDPASTDGRIASQQAAVRAKPGEPDGYVLLAASYLQKVRETGDAGYYDRARAAVDRALALDPGNAGALTERGALRLARHDFDGALADGLAAREAAPAAVRPYGVVVDALVELGRYGEAERTLQRMISLKPDLASYARVSYQRELHGDLAGAVKAMELAAAAGGSVAENGAYAGVLLGDLQFTRGRYGAARTEYSEALDRLPGYAPALAGLARVNAAGGRLAPAIARLREVVTRLPLPQYVVALGETELAAGEREAARRDFALVRVQQRALGGAGVDTDVELAIFEADHGSAEQAVVLAERAWAATPSVRAADARMWALTQAGRAREALRWIPRALALGTRDPLFLYHAGMTARAGGRPAQARGLLERALAQSPRFSPLYAPRAQAALESL
ncbi:MAG: tetratricopeptide repeat protein [Solirubrobacteraceae bacterium]